MARINLLPWREELRQEKKKEFLVQLAGVGLVVVIGCFAWVQAVDGAISDQQYRNNMLTTEISQLKRQVAEIQDLKTRKKELEQRMRVIQDLEGKRSIIVHYFDEMTKSVPDGVYFTSVERKGATFSISGVSESNQRIATFMRNINGSDWFSSPNLKSVTAEPEAGESAQVFEMDMVAVLPEGDGDNKNG